MATWYELIKDELAHQEEEWSDVIACTLSLEDLEIEFDCGFGTEEGKPFTAWTAIRVYFPWKYDGAEGVASAPRDPCKEEIKHVGGG